MKVVCINNKIYPNLQLDKVYEATLQFPLGPNGEKEWEQNYITIEGDTIKNWYDTRYFITIDKWRESQLNNIGIK